MASLQHQDTGSIPTWHSGLKDLVLLQLQWGPKKKKEKKKKKEWSKDRTMNQDDCQVILQMRNVVEFTFGARAELTSES